MRKTNDENAFLARRVIQDQRPERDPLAFASDPRYIQALEVPRAVGLLEAVSDIPDVQVALAILRGVAERDLRMAAWLEREAPYRDRMVTF